MFVNVISSFLMSSDLYMPVSSKGYKLACAPFEDSDQPAYPRSLISVFAMRSMCRQESKVYSDRTQRL